ncbi:MAG: hypothetical protein K2X45_18500 [Phreatobacter sp.]|nr:hypothetical protein [Phreatobacter sp.]
MREVDQLIKAVSELASPDVAPETIAFHYPAAVAKADRDDGTMRPCYLSESYEGLYQLSDRTFLAHAAAATQLHRLGYMAFNEPIARAFSRMFNMNAVDDMVKPAIAVSGLRLGQRISDNRIFLFAGPEKMMAPSDIAIPTTVKERTAMLSLAMQRDMTDDRYYAENMHHIVDDAQAAAYQRAAKEPPVQFEFDEVDYNTLGQPDDPTRTVLRRVDRFAVRDEDVTRFCAQLAASYHTLANVNAFDNVMVPHACGLPQLIRVKNGAAYRSVLYPVLHKVLEDIIDCPRHY